MDLGDGVVTAGRFGPDLPPNYTIFPVWSLLEAISIAGISCIDVGTVDGIVAFTLKQEGAATVVATDRGRRNTFPFVRERLGLDVPYLPGSTLDGGDISARLEAHELPAKYDLVVLAGVIYHAPDPLTVLMHARNLLKANGLLIVETASHPGTDPALQLNTSLNDPVLEPNTYFLPSAKAVQGMLNFVSCNPLATVVNGRRLAVLAQACRPSQIAEASEALSLVIREGRPLGALSFAELEGEQDVSAVEYAGRRGEWTLEPGAFRTRFSLQPAIR